MPGHQFETHSTSINLSGVPNPRTLNSDEAAAGQPSGPASEVRDDTSDIEQASQEVDLICTVDADRVRNRWLESFIPRPDQQPKALAPGTTFFIHNILKTYPGVLTKGELPPFIHSLQLNHKTLPTALANCASIARMWEGQPEGGSTIVRETTVREMDRLFNQKHSYGQYDLLVAFQAYILYVVLLLTPSQMPAISQVTMLNLQDFAFDIARTGLVCAGSLALPHKTWALAEAKRRTLFVMYMLDDIVNAFSCALWEAPGASWWRIYNTHVSEWDRSAFRLEELWRRPRDADAQMRLDRWLAQADELGMMIFAVTSFTHIK
ncbi:hypothetical protein H2203_007015 [Taxawa tesnikishii (nom. ined.)]|nr:hypothetical protein H2203_007015 [Dothideales sp. JES 119]